MPLFHLHICVMMALPLPGSIISCVVILLSLFSSISLGDTGSNLSDHQPLIAIFDYPLCAQLTPPKSSRSGVNNNVRIAWDRVTSELTQAYCEQISYSLPSPPLQAFHCTDPNCTIHRHSLETYCISLCNTLKYSADYPSSVYIYIDTKINKTGCRSSWMSVCIILTIRPIKFVY